MTDPELVRFPRGRQPFGRGTVEWARGTIRLIVSAYLTAELPPRRFVSSVRAVVLRDDLVLVQRSVEDVHILPGGQLEPGEELEEGLRREILEETGWHVEIAGPLGFEHFHHLTPEPPGYAYLYPDFLWVIYLARAVEHVPEGRLEDGYELGSDFKQVEDVRALDLTAGELQYLGVAIAALK